MNLNYKNLDKLATYLENLPKDYDKFYMGHFAESDDGTVVPQEIKAVIHNCGTSACAVGHGPSAGIRALKADADWFEYSQRVFGTDPSWDDGPFDGVDAGHYMFGEFQDGDHRDAAARIREVIAYYVAA